MEGVCLSDGDGDLNPDLQPADDITDESPKKKVKYYVHIIIIHYCTCILNFQRNTLLAMKTRANLQRIQSLTYVINDENAELLQDMNLNSLSITYQQQSLGVYNPEEKYENLDTL